MATTLRQWAGQAGIAALGIVLAVMSLWVGSPHWVLLVIAGIAGGFIYMTHPGPDHRDEDDSAFVRGDASGSWFEDVYSGARWFVDGKAISAAFRRVIHRPPKKEEGQ